MTLDPRRTARYVPHRWPRATALVVFAFCSQCSSVAAPWPARSSLQSGPGVVIHAALARGEEPVHALTAAEQRELTALYEYAEHGAIWIDETGRPISRADAALTLLERATEDGLDPARYDSVRLGSLAARLRSARPVQAAEAAAFDLTLSRSLLRYLHDLSSGQVTPQELGLNLRVPSGRRDVVMVLRRAIDADRLAWIADEIRPSLPQYTALRGMLVDYRALAADTTLEPAPAASTSIRAGERYDGLGALHRLLVAFGDLPPEAPVPSDDSAYDGPIVDGVKAFQTRHGLEPDGVIGTSTWTALSRPIAWRVRQIELALERLRWLPDLDGRRFIVVNIPMFRLWAWDSRSPVGEPALSMRVIVGRARESQTPVLSKTMEAVIFRPYWNIPTSILRDEILPALAREPGFLRREDMEIVQGAGDAARPVAATEENIGLLKQGSLRLRQRPGPGNALGLIKFVFPNEEQVYLHDTPGKRHFRQPRRDLSHGCVRVENPVGLAEWVLEDEPEWTRDRILAAAADAGNVSRAVRLNRRIDVIFFYSTAVVMPGAGGIHFAEDIYGHDRTLDRALSP